MFTGPAIGQSRPKLKPLVNVAMLGWSGRQGKKQSNILAPQSQCFHFSKGIQPIITNLQLSLDMKLEQYYFNIKTNDKNHI